MTSATLLEIHGLKTYFHSDHTVVKAVDDISLRIAPGKTLGLVGESGSGKSVTSLTVMRLLPESGPKSPAAAFRFSVSDLVKLAECRDAANARQRRQHDLSGAGNFAQSAVSRRLAGDGSDPAARKSLESRSATTDDSNCSAKSASPSLSSGSTAFRTKCPAGRSSG